MKTLIKSQHGFSIVQGMVLAGAVATLALVGTRLITDQKTVQKATVQKTKVEQLHGMVYTVLANKDHCAATFSKPDNTIERNPSTIKAAMNPNSKRNFRSVVTSDNTTIFQVRAPASVTEHGSHSSAPAAQALGPSYMNGTIFIDEMAVQYPSDLSQHAKLIVSYHRNDGNNKVMKKEIPIVVERDPVTSEFVSCYAASEMSHDLTEQFCKNFGDGVGSYFVWDEANHSCRPKDQVCHNGFLVGFDGRGDKICKSFEGWLDFSQVVDNTSPLNCAGSPDVRFDTTSVPGKVKVACTETGSVSDCDLVVHSSTQSGTTLAMAIESSLAHINPYKVEFFKAGVKVGEIASAPHFDFWVEMFIDVGGYHGDHDIKITSIPRPGCFTTHSATLD